MDTRGGRGLARWGHRTARVWRGHGAVLPGISSWTCGHQGNPLLGARLGPARGGKTGRQPSGHRLSSLAPCGGHSVLGCRHTSRPPLLLMWPRSFTVTVGSHQLALGQAWPCGSGRPLGSLKTSEGLPPIGSSSLSWNELGEVGDTPTQVCPTAGSKPSSARLHLRYESWPKRSQGPPRH